MKNLAYAIAESNAIELETRICDRASVRAFRILDGKKRLSEHLLLKAHATLMEKKGLRSDQIGSFRKLSVRVGNDIPPHGGLVPALVSNFLLDYGARPTSIEGAFKRHLRFETIHPFIDGNGRIGRLLLFSDIKHLLGKVVPIPEKYKQQYYKLFDFKDDPENKECEFFIEKFFADCELSEFMRTFETSKSTLAHAWRKNGSKKPWRAKLRKACEPFKPSVVESLPQYLLHEVVDKFKAELDK